MSTPNKETGGRGPRPPPRISGRARGLRVGVTGVRRILNHAADTAVFRPAYAAGFLVGHFVGGVALILLGRKWSR